MIRTRPADVGITATEVVDADGDVVFVEEGAPTEAAAFIAVREGGGPGFAPGAWLTADEADAFADALKALAAQWREGNR